MILHVVKGKIAPSINDVVKTAMIEWSEKWLSLVRRKWPEHEFLFLTMVRGNNHVALWIGRYESFAEWEEFFEGYWNDPEIKALYDEAAKMQESLGSPFLTETENQFYQIHEPA
jgi:hypothetical protein